MLTKRHVRWRHLVLLLAPAGLVGCATNQELEQVYCYRTLADVSCYRAPDPGREQQLVGTYRRDPQSHVQADEAPVEEAWLLGVIYASADLAGRVLSPVGTVVGLFR